MTIRHPRTFGALRRRAEHSLVTRRVFLPAQDFIHRAGVSGGLLLAAALVAMIVANSRFADPYARFWETRIVIGFGRFVFDESLLHVINDALMAVFFFVVGLEIKRELVEGDLSDVKRAAIPAAAALGGMIVPAAIYFAFNVGRPTLVGWGIPMATDIAFALGALALLGNRVPSELRLLLLALAIVDDVGSILVIALFYTEYIDTTAVIASAILVGLIIAMRTLGFRTAASYALAGTLFWLMLLKSGIHATMAGVILGALTPTRAWYGTDKFIKISDQLQNRYRSAVSADDPEKAASVLGHLEELTRGTEAPVERMERLFHPWVTFIVLPLFALANSGVAVSQESLRTALASPVAIGVGLGLVLGKPIGILGFAWLAARTGLARLPGRVTWAQMAGMSVVAGIGFTVSLFVAGLAFSEGAPLEEAKIGILAASIISGTVGLLLLRPATKQPPAERRAADR
jgi:NhaA family Na+:H+ antiporter